MFFHFKKNRNVNFSCLFRHFFSNKNAFQSRHTRHVAYRSQKTFTKKFYFSFDLEMTFTRSDLHLHMALILLLEYKLVVVNVGVKYNIFFIWPWPNYLDSQTGPKYGQGVSVYPKVKFFSYVGQKLYSEQTDTQTDRQTELEWVINYPHMRRIIKPRRMGCILNCDAFIVIFSGRWGEHSTPSILWCL